MHNLKVWTVCLDWKRPLHRQPSIQNIQMVRKSRCQQRWKQPLLADSLGHRYHHQDSLCITSLHHHTALWTYTYCAEEETEAQRGRHASEIWFWVLTFNPDLYPFCVVPLTWAFLSGSTFLGFLNFLSPVSPTSPSYFSAGTKKNKHFCL